MEKNKKIAGYIYYHKPVEYGVWNDSIWTPLQVNAEKNGAITLYGGYYDNQGDNISDWNLLFAEMTGLYWVWKNHPKDCEYVGVTQYRRRFDVHTEEEILNMFADHNVIAAQPLLLNASVKRHYGACHNKSDIETVKNIVLRLYPEYGDSWNKFIETSNLIFYSNGYMLRTDDFDSYCEWLFSILFEFKRIMNWKTPKDLKKYIQGQIACRLRPNWNNQGKTENAVEYQSQLCGFVSERLWTLWLRHNFKPEEIQILPYLKLENTKI